MDAHVLFLQKLESFVAFLWVLDNGLLIDLGRYRPERKRATLKLRSEDWRSWPCCTSYIIACFLHKNISFIFPSSLHGDLSTTNLFCMSFLTYL
ncbi:hypothetical protein Peur_052987 [Populus x canadensis]